MNGLRLVGVVTVLLAGILAAEAQQLPMHQGAIELGVWSGGGTGLGHSTSFQFANAGFRVGTVLTGEHGPGVLRGNFEYAADITPLYLVFQDIRKLNSTVAIGRETVYGGAISPLILKWNFTSGKKIVPFAGVEGTAIFTTKNVPSGDTSVVNFGSGIAGGIQVLRGEHHSLNFTSHLMHISNASLGNHNPSINIALQFRVGYSWWR